MKYWLYISGEKEKEHVRLDVAETEEIHGTLRKILSRDSATKLWEQLYKFCESQRTDMDINGRVEEIQALNRNSKYGSIEFFGAASCGFILHDGGEQYVLVYDDVCNECYQRAKVIWNAFQHAMRAK